MDGSYHRGNDDVTENVDPKEFFHAVIRGDITYVPPYDDGDARIESEETDEAVKSWMNASGDGMEIDPFNEEQTNNKDEGQLQTNTDGEVYTYLASRD